MSKSEASCLESEWVPQTGGEGRTEGDTRRVWGQQAQDQGIQGAKEGLTSTTQNIEVTISAKSKTTWHFLYATGIYCRQMSQFSAGSWNIRTSLSGTSSMALNPASRPVMGTGTCCSDPTATRALWPQLLWVWAAHGPRSQSPGSHPFPGQPTASDRWRPGLWKFNHLSPMGTLPIRHPAL